MSHFAGAARAIARLRRWSAGIPLLLVLLAGCGQTQGACTEVECIASVSVELPELEGAAGEELRITFCIDGDCEDVPRVLEGDLGDQAAVYREYPLPARSVPISVTVYDERERVVLRATGTKTGTLTFPNGRDCAGECRVVTVRAEGGRLVDG